MSKYKLATVLVAMGVASLSYGAMEEGTKELALSGSLDFDTAFDTEVRFGAGLGFFVADGVEIGPQVSVFYNDLITLVSLGAFIEYNLQTEGALVPFIGGAAAWGQGDLEDGGDSDAVVGSLRAGAKYFMSEDWAIALTGIFDVASEDIYAEDDEEELSDTDYRIELGIRTFF